MDDLLYYSSVRSLLQAQSHAFKKAPKRKLDPRVEIAARGVEELLFETKEREAKCQDNKASSV